MVMVYHPEAQRPLKADVAINVGVPGVMESAEPKDLILLLSEAKVASQANPRLRR